jgi:hypothetical protein
MPSASGESMNGFLEIVIVAFIKKRTTRLDCSFVFFLFSYNLEIYLLLLLPLELNLFFAFWARPRKKSKYSMELRAYHSSNESMLL